MHKQSTILNGFEPAVQVAASERKRELKMSQIFTHVPQGISLSFRGFDLILAFISWRLISLVFPGFNSAVEALNTLPQDILAEMVS